MTNSSRPDDLERSIQQILQTIALQMEYPLDEVEAGDLYQEASHLLNHISYEPVTLARVAGILLVYQIQDAAREEVEWFKSQLQQFSQDEEVEELIESFHRVDSL
jgi:hypothetical protein